MRDPSPLELHDPRHRDAFATAVVWLSLAIAIYLAWKLSDVLLLIFGGLVFAAFFVAFANLIGRVLPAPRGVRIALAALLFVVLLAGFVLLAGTQIAQQAGELRGTLQEQLGRASQLAERFGLGALAGGGDPLQALAKEVQNYAGRITSAIGTIAGGLGSLAFMAVFGLYVAAEPRLYERGVEWLTPRRSRARVRTIAEAVSKTLQRWVAGRLLTMLIEGLLIFVGLWIGGVPLAGVLALIAGTLAFIPNIGAFISGLLIVAVGFSAGTEPGLWALGTYLVVQTVEGNVLTPLIEKKAVDLAPATVLAAQLLFGALFGIVGVALADPIVAAAKVALEKSREPAEPVS